MDKNCFTRIPICPYDVHVSVYTGMSIDMAAVRDFHSKSEKGIIMNTRPKYKTKQREILLGYLETVSGTHITAGDVCEYFREHGSPMAQSTVYRQLESLVDEGIMNKYINAVFYLFRTNVRTFYSCFSAI